MNVILLQQVLLHIASLIVIEGERKHEYFGNEAVGIFNAHYGAEVVDFVGKVQPLRSLRTAIKFR